MIRKGITLDEYWRLSRVRRASMDAWLKATAVDKMQVRDLLGYDEKCRAIAAVVVNVHGDHPEYYVTYDLTRIPVISPPPLPGFQYV